MKMRCVFGLLAVGLAGAAVAADGLAEGFRTPPHAAKPHTWYHMMNGNVTKRGITADFEALAKAGVGGVQMFDAGCGIPAGGLDFGSDAWFDLLAHAMREAKRLGLEVCLPNCSGWSSSGGPWIAPSNGMKRLVFSWSDAVTGPAPFRGRLSRTEKDNGFYADIAVLGVPVPEAETMPLPPVRETREGDVVTLAFDRPTEISGFSYTLEYGWCWDALAQLVVELSDDGVAFRPLETLKPVLGRSGVCDHGERFRPFPKKVTARALRLRFSTPYPLNPGDLKVRLGAVRPERKMRLEGLSAKRFETRLETPATVAETDASQVVGIGRVIDLTSRLKGDGTLDWQVPSGTWKVLRVGFVCSGQRNHPASRCGEGLEVDKLDAKALDFHFEQYVGRLCRMLGSECVGHDDCGFNGILIDSYEVGSQNWTQGFERTFRREAGYDITPWLPALAGAVIDSVPASERFLEDFRRVVARTFAENYGLAMQRKCREYGLKLYLEPYGNCPADNLAYGRSADVPTGEFWSQGGLALDAKPGNAKYVSYLAHVWGRPIVAMESFTAMPCGGSGRWQKTPFGLKAQGDRAFAAGVNRIVYHRFVHQPWGERGPVPGLTMGMYGMHFDRTQTWWPLIGPWLAYQGRVQYMLQQGTFVADALFFSGDAVPNQCGNTDGGSKSAYSLPYGYDWDVANAEGLAAMSVVQGRLVSPGGVSYAFLVVPEGAVTLPSTAASVARLKAAGACVVADGAAELKRRGSEPQFALADASAQSRVSWQHRRLGDGSDVFFVADATEKGESVEVSFAGTDRVPELWDAETGDRVRARDWSCAEGRTRVRLTFGPVGSTFVVFRGTAGTLPVEERTEPRWGEPMKGPWRVRFAQRVTNAPDEVREVTFDALADWTASSDPFVRYFSGTAEYALAHPGAGVLDLGTVKDFAEVLVDGRSVATLWKPPFRCRIPSGKTLSVRVTNRWPNRLIGDAQLPEDCEWLDNGAIKCLPDWVKRGEPSPTGRRTFTTWRHWKKDDALLPSGLLGPVRFAAAAAERNELKYMTFNIWGAYFGNPVHERDLKQAAYILRNAPDVVGMQEAMPDFWKSRLFPELSAEYGVVRSGTDPNAEFNPLLYRKRRLELVEGGTHVYAGKDNPEGSKGFGWAVLKDRATGRSFIAYSTHLWWKSQPPEERAKHDRMRVNNIRELLAKVAELRRKYGELPVVGGGDLNTTENVRLSGRETPLNDLLAAGYCDAQYSVGNASRWSSHHGDPRRDAQGVLRGYVSPEAADPRNSLDHVHYTRDSVVPLSLLVDRAPDVLECSDHSPVIFTFGLK